MKQVLLVEDDVLNRTVVEDIFQFDGIEADLICVNSGEDALDRAGELKLDLILMDIGLPGIDGLEATRRLHRNPELRHIPVWAITAHAMKGDADLAMAAGCSTYITKPIDSKDLAIRLRNFFDPARCVEGTECASC
jgi:two-component system cell cycle response regulator DivK